MSDNTSPTPNSLTSEQLIQRLAAGNCNLEDLARDLQVDAKQISEVLNSPSCQEQIQFRINLAITQARLQAAQAVARCRQALERLTASERPETARRAAMTLMNIAGLSTEPAKPAANAEPKTQSAAGTRFRALNTSLRTATHPIVRTPSPTPLRDHFAPIPAPQIPAPTPLPSPIINQNPNDSALFAIPETPIAPLDPT